MFITSQDVRCCEIFLKVSPIKHANAKSLSVIYYRNKRFRGKLDYFPPEVCNFRKDK